MKDRQLRWSFLKREVIMNNPLGLYIHIPFCVKKCDYCDFLSFGGTAQETKDQYVHALCHELEAISKKFKGQLLSTIYIGGGTPSVLSDENFISLMTTVNHVFQIEAQAEVTMELNPGTVDAEAMKLYMSYGINRVSMGLQSDNDQQLKALGRIHTYQTYEDTYNMMRDMGMKNLNVDVMFGLSNQTMADWRHTLETLIKLNPEHVSAYSLIIEADTVYETKYDQGKLNLPDEDLERKMFWFTHEFMKEAGYDHYEISNYAKDGYASKHNSSYWDLTPYVGTGLGASSYYDGCRYKNTSSMAAYIEVDGVIEEIRELEQTYKEATALEEAFFLGLRKLRGVNVESLRDTYGNTLLLQYDEIIASLVTEGLLLFEDGNLRLTKRGVDLSNQVMSHFIL